jgi:GR25 family glycosyltransferase involved in LPS biosynthesis
MRVNDYFDRVLVINLDRRTDRLEKVTAELNALGIEFERLSAVDAVAEGITPVIACMLSHIKAAEMAAGHRVLILEDDATFAENFNERFTMFIEALPADWDMFYLGAYQLNVEPCNNFMVRAIDTSSMHAYCIRPEKLEEMIQVAKDYDGHIDVAYRFHHPKIKAYAAKPTLVRQSPSYSDIECKDVDYMSWYV